MMFSRKVFHHFYTERDDDMVPSARRVVALSLMPPRRHPATCTGLSHRVWIPPSVQVLVICGCRHELKLQVVRVEFIHLCRCGLELAIYIRLNSNQ